MHNRYSEKSGTVLFDGRDTGYMFLGKRDSQEDLQDRDRDRDRDL